MKDWLKSQLARLGLASAAVDAVAPAGEEEQAPVLLLVDDNPTNLQVLVETLRPQGYTLLVAKDGAAALTLAKRSTPSLILLDVMMPGMDGYEVCRRLKADADLASAAVIFCSALDDTEAKVKGLGLGAVDFITKPFQPEEVIARVGTHLAVQRLASSLQLKNDALTHELEVARAHHDEVLKRLEWMLAGDSGAVRHLRAEIEQQGQMDAALLLSGPASCGDEAVARAVHAASARRDGPFLAIDCSMLTADEEAAVFDAQGGRRSRMALAQQGTIYFQHVTHLTLEGQKRLHEAIENSRAHVVAYTSQERPRGPHLHTELFLRLERNPLKLPTLVDRRGDVPALALHVLSREARRLGRAVRDIAPDSLERLQAHDWPGNLRELEDVIVRSVALGKDAQLRIDDSLLQSGRPLGGYRLVKRLSAGAFGEVWTANHQLLARPAAVKLIKGPSDEEMVERFRREARATAQLASPHTVRLFDFGVSEGGEFFYVMELLEGMDFETMLRKHGVVAPARLAALLIDACKSLAEAHASGFVHRHLKPSNMFVCRIGMEVDFVKVLDFGLARRPSGSAEARLTGKDDAVGTPDYIAPETVTGQVEIDGRTDMYSLGATAWHLLVGHPVFTAGTAVQKALAHATQSAPPLPDSVPEPLRGLVMRCLRKNINERPTAAQMWHELEDSDLPRQWTPRNARAFWAAHAQ